MRDLGMSCVGWVGVRIVKPGIEWLANSEVIRFSLLVSSVLVVEKGQCGKTPSCVNLFILREGWREHRCRSLLSGEGPASCGVVGDSRLPCLEGGISYCLCLVRQC